MKPPYKFIEVARSRHGQEVVYFRRGRGARHRLPPLGSPSFREAYFAALNGRPIPHVKDMPTRADVRKQGVERYFRAFLPNAKASAAKKGRGFDLTLDWLIAHAEKQDFRCALTGIPFFSDAPSQSSRSPFAPSIDRVDCAKGYTTDNVRLVIFALNVMILDWGTDVFEQVANAYRYTKTRTSIPAP